MVFSLYFHWLQLGVQLDSPGFIVHENQPKKTNLSEFLLGKKIYHCQQEYAEEEATIVIFE